MESGPNKSAAAHMSYAVLLALSFIKTKFSSQPKNYCMNIS